jgi:hypothetical protein
MNTFATIWHYATEIVTVASIVSAALPADVSSAPAVKVVVQAIDFLALNVFHATTVKSDKL